MAVTIKHPMVGISPSNVDTLAALILIRSRQYLRHAITCIRYAEWNRAERALGLVDGQIKVLYDLNYDGSYHMLCHARRVESVLNKLTNSGVDVLSW